MLVRDPAEARRHIKFRRRKKRGHEAPRNHVVNFRLHFVEMRRRRAGRDDGEVIGNFGVVEDAFVRAHPVVVERRLAVFGKVAGQFA